MLKETGYQEKIEWIRPWLVQVIEVVKKDLKQEHLKIDREFCKKYFLGKGYNSVTADQMAPAYAADIAAGNVGLGEFIASRWLLKNTDVYEFFERKLKPITPDFDQLDMIDEGISTQIMKEAVDLFGAVRTYLFVVLNSVVFPETVIANLRLQAQNYTTQHEKTQEEERIEKNLENMQKKHQREMAALMDKHEKRLVGLQKKYLKDTEMLKEQVRRLQKQKDD
jgi:hypothetical protein